MNGIDNGIDFGEKFLQFQRTYRKPDGSRWSAADIERSTERFVRANYITNLVHGRISQPGYDRLRAIAQVMGFPTEVWFHKDQFEPPKTATSTLADKLNSLFKAANKTRPKKQPLTEREVADLTFGQLTEEQVIASRRGKVEDLKGAQYLALSNVFGVPISYWYVLDGELPSLDPTVMTELRTEKGRMVLHKFHGLTDEQKDLMLSLLDQLGKDSH